MKRNERIRGRRKGGGNLKASPAEEVEVVWECDVKIGARRRKEGGGNGHTWEEKNA